MRGDVEALNERERETLRLLLSGHDAKSIARHFDLSVHTVNDRLREARRKLGVSSSREAARLLAQTESVQPNFSAGKQLGGAKWTTAAVGEDPSTRHRGEVRSFAWFAGGMVTVSLIIVAAVLSSTLSGSTATKAPITQEAAAPLTAAEAGGVSAAKAWVELLDGQKWAQSWRAAGTIFKSRLPETQWAPKIASLWQSMGTTSSRVLKDVKTATSLPGAPDGQYEIVQFQTNFTDKGGAIETVVLANQDSGWKVDGYFIR